MPKVAKLRGTLGGKLHGNTKVNPCKLVFIFISLACSQVQVLTEASTSRLVFTIDDQIAQAMKDQEMLASLVGQMGGDLTQQNNVLHARCAALETFLHARCAAFETETEVLRAEIKTLIACHEALASENKALRTWANEVFGILRHLNLYAEV
jgi:hypothetical protein